MNNGRVVHFEDNPQLTIAVKRGLELFSDRRHQVIGGAADLAGSLAVLDQIDSGEVQANVVMFDGDLGQGNNDARSISERIRELGLPVRTIGVSSHPMSKLGVEVDADLPKGDYAADKLVAIIDEFEEPEPVK